MTSKAWIPGTPTLLRLPTFLNDFKDDLWFLQWGQEFIAQGHPIDARYLFHIKIPGNQHNGHKDYENTDYVATLLHIAVRLGSGETLTEWLIEMGARMDIPDSDGWCFVKYALDYTTPYGFVFVLAAARAAPFTLLDAPQDETIPLARIIENEAADDIECVLRILAPIRGPALDWCPMAVAIKRFFDRRKGEKEYRDVMILVAEIIPHLCSTERSDYPLDVLVELNSNCVLRMAPVIIMGLQKCRGRIHGNGRDALRLVAEHVGKQRHRRILSKRAALNMIISEDWGRRRREYRDSGEEQE